MIAETVEIQTDLPPFSTPAQYYGVADARATVVVLPAMGTRARVYEPFARSLTGA